MTKSYKARTSTGEHSVLRMADAIRRKRYKTGSMKGRFKPVSKPHSGKKHSGKTHVTHKHTGSAHLKHVSSKKRKGVHFKHVESKKHKGAKKESKKRTWRPIKPMATTAIPALATKNNDTAVIAFVAFVFFVVIAVAIVLIIMSPTKPSSSGTSPGSVSESSSRTPAENSDVVRTVVAVVIGLAVLLLIIGFLNRTRIGMFFRDLRGDRDDLFRESVTVRSEIYNTKAGSDEKSIAGSVLDSILKSSMPDNEKRAALAAVRNAIRSDPTMKSFARSMTDNTVLKDFYERGEVETTDRKTVRRWTASGSAKKFWSVNLDSGYDTEAREILEQEFKDKPKIIEAFMNERERAREVDTDAGSAVSKMLDAPITTNLKAIIVPTSNQMEMVEDLKKGRSAFFGGEGGTGKSATVRSFVATMNSEGKPYRLVTVTRSSIAQAMGGDISVEAFGSYLEALVKLAGIKAAQGEKVVIFFDEIDTIVNDITLGPVFKQYIETMPDGVQLISASNKEIIDKAALDRFPSKRVVKQMPAKEFTVKLQEILAREGIDVRIDARGLETQVSRSRDFFTEQAKKITGETKKVSSRVLDDLVRNIKSIKEQAPDEVIDITFKTTKNGAIEPQKFSM